MKLASLTAMLAMVLCGALHAQGESLFAKTHQGAKESKVAADWYAKLPQWVDGNVKKNNFIRTWLLLDEKFKPSDTPNKFEIRDANKDRFSIYLLVRDGIEGNMETKWAATKETTWLEWGRWPAKYIISSYPVETSSDTKDLVAFAAWLFDRKEPDLANRVLTVAHEKDKDLAPLIEAYLREKNKWEGAEPLVRWNLWDTEFRKERPVLIPAAIEATRKAAVEKEATTAFQALLKMRGDYEGKPPRRNPPTKMLILVDWEIKQFKIQFAASEFMKNPKNIDKLEKMASSIVDDQTRINDGMVKANALAKDKNDQKGMNAKLTAKEELLKLDPENYQIRAQIGNEWYDFCQPDEYGNDCKNPAAALKAVEHYRKLLEYFPHNLAYMLAMGKCYQARQDSKNAAPIYERVIKIDGPNGNYTKAAEALKRNMEAKDDERQAKAAK